jgi:hypothetical protein
MPDEHILALRQAFAKRRLADGEADQARTDYAVLESELEVMQTQLARIPTRAFLCSMLLLATASVWALLALVLLMRQT